MPQDRSARMPVPDFVHPERSSRRRLAQAFHSLAAALRLSIGWVFFWAFLDKLLALGFATGRNPVTGVVDRFSAAAWINGGSPTVHGQSYRLRPRAGRARPGRRRQDSRPRRLVGKNRDGAAIRHPQIAPSGAG